MSHTAGVPLYSYTSTLMIDVITVARTFNKQVDSKKMHSTSTILIQLIFSYIAIQRPHPLKPSYWKSKPSALLVALSRRKLTLIFTAFTIILSATWPTLIRACGEA